MTATKTDCLVVQPIAGCGLELLHGAGLSVHVAGDTSMESLRPHLATARAVITRNHGLSAAEIAVAPRLAVIVSHGTGVDSIDLAEASRRGIPVLSTPGANAQSVAEHTLALMLACTKAVAEADQSVRRGDHQFRYRRETVDLAGRVLGLVGYGRIARRVARLAQGFEMTVHACSRHSGRDEMQQQGVTWEANLDCLLERADVVSLHTVPGQGFFLGPEQISRMRPGAILVNTARGALLDEDALAAALRSERIAAAGLDVFRDEPLSLDSPLIGCPCVVLTPHIGGSSREALDRTARAAATKVLDALVRRSGAADTRVRPKGPV